MEEYKKHRLIVRDTKQDKEILNKDVKIKDEFRKEFHSSKFNLFLRDMGLFCQLTPLQHGNLTAENIVKACDDLKSEFIGGGIGLTGHKIHIGAKKDEEKI